MKLAVDKPIWERVSSARGVTLVEIVISIAILTIGLLGYFSLHIRALQLASSASVSSQANNVAIGVQDMLQSLPFTADTLPDLYVDCGELPSNSVADLCYVPEPAAVNESGEGVPNPVEGQRVFYRSWLVEPVSASADPNAPGKVRIVVRVRYPDALARCPDCGTGSELSQGWGAVTLVSYRTAAAY